jgi:hypothetical protein
MWDWAKINEEKLFIIASRFYHPFNLLYRLNPWHLPIFGCGHFPCHHKQLMTNAQSSWSVSHFQQFPFVPHSFIYLNSSTKKKDGMTFNILNWDFNPKSQATHFTCIDNHVISFIGEEIVKSWWLKQISWLTWECIVIVNWPWIRYFNLAATF